MKRSKVYTTRLLPAAVEKETGSGEGRDRHLANKEQPAAEVSSEVPGPKAAPFKRVYARDIFTDDDPRYHPTGVYDLGGYRGLCARTAHLNRGRTVPRVVVPYKAPTNGAVEVPVMFKGSGTIDTIYA